MRSPRFENVMHPLLDAKSLPSGRARSAPVSVPELGKVLDWTVSRPTCAWAGVSRRACPVRHPPAARSQAYRFRGAPTLRTPVYHAACLIKTIRHILGQGIGNIPYHPLRMIRSPLFPVSQQAQLSGFSAWSLMTRLALPPYA